MATIAGASVLGLTADGCTELIGWVTGQATQPADVGAAEWLLAHCDDGVVWGHRRTQDGSWLLSCNVFPELTASLTVDRLQELRLFGPQEEFLIWPDRSGLRGRRLIDQAQPGGWGVCEPLTDTRVLIGDRCQHRERGFTLVADAAGSRQAVPIDCPPDAFEGRSRRGAVRSRWPLRLHVRHYLDLDPITGAVRVANSRLVAVTCEGEAR